MQLGVERDGQLLTLEATLIQNPTSTDVQRGFLGVSPYSDDRVAQSFTDALVEGPSDLVTGVGQAISGVAKVLNPVSVWGHLVGTNDDPTSRPGTIVGATRISDDIGDFDGWAGLLTLMQQGRCDFTQTFRALGGDDPAVLLIASVNVSVGVFNMFPLLPLDGGHAAIATYERIRSRKGKRYFADVNKLMPVAALCLALIAFMFLTGLYLDVVKS